MSRRGRHTSSASRKSWAAGRRPKPPTSTERAHPETPVIPVLKPDDAPVSAYVEFLAELRARGFGGDISTGYADRTVQATDNSVYQRMPQAIVFPRDATDVVRIGKLAAEDRFGGITLVPRGGGTGTNGQSLTDGVV